MLPERVSRRRRYILSHFPPLLHRKYLCLLRPQWEEHCAVVSWEAVGCRDGRQRAGAWTYIAGWRRTAWCVQQGTLNGLGLEQRQWDCFFLFILHHLPRTDCKSACCVPVDVFEVEFYKSTAETFYLNRDLECPVLTVSPLTLGRMVTAIHFSLRIITHLLRVCVCVLITVRLNIS